MIGAGSVVTSAIPPWVVAAGQPAAWCARCGREGGGDRRRLAARLALPAAGRRHRRRTRGCSRRALRERVDVVIAAPGGARRADAPTSTACSRSRDGAARAALLERFRPDALYVQFAIAVVRRARCRASSTCCDSPAGAGIRVVTAFHEPERELAALPVLGRAIYRRIGGADRRAGGATARPARDALAAAGDRRRPRRRVPHGVPALPRAASARRHRARARALRPARPARAGARLRPSGQGRRRPRRSARPVLLPAVARRDDRDRRRSRARGAALFRVFGRVDARHLAAAAGGDGVGGRPDPVLAGSSPTTTCRRLLAAATVMVLPYRRITQSGIAHLCVAGAVPAVASRLDGLRGDARRGRASTSRRRRRHALAAALARRAGRRRRPRPAARCAGRASRGLGTGGGRRPDRRGRARTPGGAGAASSAAGGRALNASRGRHPRERRERRRRVVDSHSARSNQTTALTAGIALRQLRRETVDPRRPSPAPSLDRPTSGSMIGLRSA